MIYAVIMAGGTGTRFWPESRVARPKQLLSLVGTRSMIQSTVDRLNGLCDVEHCLVVTNRSLIDPIAAQLPNLPYDHLIGEPCKRDTAPCIGLAAHWVQRRDPHAVMLVLPADHVIRAHREFQAAVERGLRLLEEDPSRLITFGIHPTYPADSFGYIERGSAPHAGADGIYPVQRFREKPDRQTAAEFLSRGGFYWNAGIFLWRAETILAALREYEPDMAGRVDRIAESMGTDRFAKTLDREFSAIVGKPIDYAVLERHPNVWMVEATFDWDDVGSWNSLARLSGKDSQGNTIQASHIGIETSDTIVRGVEGHLIVTVGVHDCIVVHTKDATLIANRSNEEQLRQVVQALAERGWSEFL